MMINNNNIILKERDSIKYKFYIYNSVNEIKDLKEQVLYTNKRDSVIHNIVSQLEFEELDGSALSLSMVIEGIDKSEIISINIALDVDLSANDNMRELWLAFENEFGDKIIKGEKISAIIKLI